jgi:hypothetical protein
MIWYYINDIISSIVWFRSLKCRIFLTNNFYSVLIRFFCSKKQAILTLGPNVVIPRLYLYSEKTTIIAGHWLLLIIHFSLYLKYLTRKLLGKRIFCCCWTNKTWNQLLDYNLMIFLVKWREDIKLENWGIHQRLIGTFGIKSGISFHWKTRLKILPVLIREPYIIILLHMFAKLGAK